MGFKNRIANFITKYSLPPNWMPVSFSSTGMPADLLQMFGQSTTQIDTKTKQGQQNAYDFCPIIGTCIDRRADFVQSGVLKIVDKDLNEVTNSQAAQYLKLLNQPNPLMDADEFERVVSVYYDTFGFCPIFEAYPAQRVGSGLPSALWPVNPLYFNVTLSGKLYGQSTLGGIVSGVEFSNPGGGMTKLVGEEQLNQLWIFNGKTINSANLYTAQSPLYSLTDAINLFQVSVNVYGQLVEQSILGILSNKSRDAAGSPLLDPDTKTSMQDLLTNNYGLTKYRNKYYLTGQAIFFQSLLTNVGNLQIPEGLKQATAIICDRIGIQVELLALKEGTYENKKSAEIAQYTNQTIPYCQKFAKALTSMLAMSGMQVYYDFEEISVLQKDKKAEADRAQILVNMANTMITNGTLSIKSARQFLIDEDIIDETSTEGKAGQEAVA